MNTLRRTVSQQVEMKQELDNGGSSFSHPPQSTMTRSLFTALEETEVFYTYNILGALAAVLFLALVSGMFLGLLTLDTMDLQIVQRTSIDANERQYAANILPVVKDRHRLLVTLLIMNALAYETLPLFLNNMVPSWVAVLLSTTLILVFGEILPSGIFMGPKQLYLGNKVLPVTKFFLWFLYPVAAPLARWLDCLTGTSLDDNTHDGEYNRGELTALLQIQHERQTTAHTKASRMDRGSIRKNDSNAYQNHHYSSTIPRTHHHHGATTSGSSSGWSSIKAEIMERAYEGDMDDESLPAIEQLTPPLHRREVEILQGALQMKTSLALDVYTPYKHVYGIPDNLILDRSTITIIYSHGYSRVPVYRFNEKDPTDTTAVLGFLMTRQLMLIDWDDKRELSTLPLQRPTCVSPRTNLVDLFDILQTGAPLLTFVCASPLLANKALAAEKPIPVEAGLMGIVTLVDVMESILQERIFDEEDIRERDRAVATLTRWAATKLQSFVVKSAYRQKQERQGALSLPTARGGALPTSNAKDKVTPLLTKTIER